MTTESTVPAAPAPPSGAAAPAAASHAAAPAAPAPGSPEHKAAMIAAYDAQFGQPAAAPASAPAAAPAPAADPNAPAPKLTDDPTAPKAEVPKEGEQAPKEGEGSEKPAAPNLGELFDKGEFTAGFAAEKLPENLSKSLEAAGLKAEQIAAIHESFRAGQAALQREVTTSLHKAAGGPEQFAALVKWGQTNLTPEQRTYYDNELNGPNAAEAIAVLSARMNKSADPRLVQASASANPPVVAFRDASEMQIAMSDPRYKTSEAFRREVGERLRHSRF